MKIEAGAHPKEIQEEAGHSSYNTTMNIYGHLFESRGEKTADAMDAMYRAAQNTWDGKVVAIGSAR